MEPDAIPPGCAAVADLVVAAEHTASAHGSGAVDVFATPAMVALMERAARDAVQPFLPAGWTTVGTRIEVDHLRATPLGGRVTARARLLSREGRLLEFAVEAADDGGVVGRGRHRRAVVELARFMARLGKA